MFDIIIDELFINLVREDVDFFVEGDFGQGGEFIFGVDGAGRISWGIDDDHFGHGAHVFAKEFRGKFVAIFGFGGNDDGFAASDADHFWVAEPVGGRNKDFIALVDGGKDRIKAGVFSTAADDDLGRFVGEIVVGL